MGPNMRAGARGSRSFYPSDLLLALELLGQRAYFINLAHTFDDSSRVHSDRTVLCTVVNKITGQRFDVSIEDQTDKFTIAIHHWRTGVAAGNVVSGHKIHRSGQIEFVASRFLFGSEVPRILIAEAGRSIVEPVKRCEWWSNGSVIGIAVDCAIREPQRERSVGVCVLAVDREARLSQLLVRRLEYAGDFVSIEGVARAPHWIHAAGSHDHGIGGCGHCGLATIQQALANRRIAELGPIDESVNRLIDVAALQDCLQILVVGAKLFLRKRESGFHIKLVD